MLKRCSAAILAVAVVMASMLAGCGDEKPAPGNGFADRVNLVALGRSPLHDTGRLKAVDSYTHAVMREIAGRHQINGRPDTFTYFDMMFRPAVYVDRNVIYVHKKQIRARIEGGLARASADLRSAADLAAAPEMAQQMRDTAVVIETRARRFMETGLISKRLLQRPEVTDELNAMRADVIRTAKFVQEIDLARALAHPLNLRAGLRIIPPPGGAVTTPWLTPDEFASAPAERLLDAAMQSDVRSAWSELEAGWIAQDSERVNAAVDLLTTLLPTVESALYPAARRTGWPWSFDARSSVPGWIASLALLGGLALLAVGLAATGRRGGAAIPAAAAAIVAMLQSGTLAIGRADWLSLESFYFTNQHWFTLVWIVYMFSVIFLLMSVVYRWNGARFVGMAIFLLAFAAHSATVLLRWNVADRWPNSNMFEAVTTAAWFGGCAAIIMEVLVRRSAMRNLFALGSAVASMTALMAAHFLPQYLNASISNKMPVLDDVWLYIHTNMIIFSYCLIFMAAIVAALYLGYRVAAALGGFGGPHHYARVGGAGSLIMTRPTGETYLAAQKTTVGQVFDGATMILMELSFILLWTGLVMGAIWADHSWGRPWGWDPKEVFALNTFLVFVVLVHVRLKTRDKGLWTSLLVLAGCTVMLFNWIFINFKISGLHSYA